MQPASSSLGEEIPHDSSSASSSSSTEAAYRLSGLAFCGHEYTHVFLLHLHRIINNNVTANSTRLHLSFGSSIIFIRDSHTNLAAIAIIFYQK